MSPRGVLLAPDKFKGSLTAIEVARAVRRGLERTRPDLAVRLLPVADGGDGTLAAAVAAGFELVPVDVRGPTGAPVRSGFAHRSRTAVVEMADACGLARLADGAHAPMTASSHGLGDAIAAALDAADRVVVGIGGSASTDGGSGLLSALGARLLDEHGDELPAGGRALAQVASLDLDGLHPRLADVEIVVASDVDSPLTGEAGAAAVYGPQKGASPADVAALDSALSRWADVVAGTTGSDLRAHPGAGAAGGVGFAALAALGAELRPGIDLVLDLIGFEEAVSDADLVVTGEGSLDLQTLRGKAPVGVARAARSYGVPVVAVCGRREIDDGRLRDAGIDAAYALSDLDPDPARCMRDAEALLAELGATAVARHLPPGQV